MVSKIIFPLPWERVRVRGMLANVPPHLGPLPRERMKPRQSTTLRWRRVINDIIRSEIIVLDKSDVTLSYVSKRCGSNRAVK